MNMEHFAISEEARMFERYPGLFAAINEFSPASMVESSIPITQYAQINGIDSAALLDEVAPIYFNYMWRKHRVIYQIDKTLMESFLTQAEKMEESEKLPCELLKNLPYPCINIESTPFRVDAPRENRKNFKIGFTGNFYVMFEKKRGTFEWGALNGLWELTDGRLVSFYIPLLENGTIGDCIDALHVYLKSGFSEVEISRADAEAEIAPFLVAIQIVLYLQAQNADTQDDAAQKKKKKPRKKAAQKPHTSAKPPKIVYVGYKVGKAIRAYDGEKSTSTGAGTPKRPHSRRGHWHHFWVGSRNDVDNRKLVLKWVAPTIVHADKDNETTTIMRVK